MTARDFSHLDRGTDETVWREAWARREATAERDGWRATDAAGILDGIRRLVAIAAHPDDETHGAGGLIALAADAGVAAEVVALTAGEGSHPHSPTRSRDDLRRIRRGELERAVGVLHAGAGVRHVGLPDGAVADHVDEATAAIVSAIGREGAGTLVVAPWRHDGHPDHEAAAAAASAAAVRTDARLLEYPVWLWHWGTPGDVPWSDAVRLGLDARAVDRKRHALRMHASQVAPLSPAAGDEAVVGAQMLARAAREHETFFAHPVADGALERVHRERRDPWLVDSSAYEAAKRAATLDALPRPRYRLAIDAGCSIGRLTVELADRAARVIALDGSPTAVTAARERTARLGHVTVAHADLPGDWCAAIERAAGACAGAADLVVVSELGYFLSPRRLAGLLDRACATLEPGGDLVLCHWRHAIDGWPLDAAAVHAAADAHPLLQRVAHVDAGDYLLGTYRRVAA